MINGVLEAKGEKPQVFQVMLLNNNDSQVEVEEAEQIDFLRIQEHLKQGESVFITSKSSEKINLTQKKKKANRNKNKMKTVNAYYFDHV
jgi:hypothetical protein